ncbi:MAG: tetratricopeptide repeat protein, partial [Ignavibacteriales bacterium]|nr:tetratricopeptide repeat protein [Ignavibacteriales bacterium]
MKRISGILLWILLSMMVTQAEAQNQSADSLVFRSDVERLFVQAMRHFQGARFDSAAALFMRCIKEFPIHHRTTGAYIMAGKAYYRLGNFRESVRILKNFIDLYPGSSYIPDAHYTLGLDFYRMLRYDDAAEELVTAHRLSGDALLRSRSEKLLDGLASQYLTVADLQLLLGSTPTQPVDVLLSVRLAERLLRSGDVKAARDLLLPLVDLPPRVAYIDKAIDLLRRVQGSGVLKIGVVLPLMLKTSQPGQGDLGVEMYDGIKLAVEEYNLA